MFGVCLNMKVVSQNNNINFTSIPIHRVNIRNAKTNELVPAIFSKLNPAEEIDRAAINEIKKNWKEVDTLLMESLTDGFTQYAPKTEKYYSIELNNDKTLSKKIVGIAKFFQEKNLCINSTDNKKLYLNNLIISPELSYNSEHRNLKNVGEVLFGGIVKYTKKTKFDSLNFFSEADDFYFKTLEHAGIKIRDNEDIFHLNSHEFTIDKKYFDQILNYWSKTFKINFSA